MPIPDNFSTEYPNYFPGQYLLAEDFALQHKYFSDMQKLDQRVCLVPGIIEGLRVTGETTNILTIEKGIAINGKGEYIVVKEDLQRQITKDEAQYSWFVLIENEQTFSACQEPEDMNTATRTKEQGSVKLLKSCPLDDESKVFLGAVSINESCVIGTIHEGIQGISTRTNAGLAIPSRYKEERATIVCKEGEVIIDSDVAIEGNFRVTGEQKEWVAWIDTSNIQEAKAHSSDSQPVRIIKDSKMNIIEIFGAVIIQEDIKADSTEVLIVIDPDEVGQPETATYLCPAQSGLTNAYFLLPVIIMRGGFVGVNYTEALPANSTVYLDGIRYRYTTE